MGSLLGKVLASIVMIVGYRIIAVPSCPRCSADGHDPDTVFCKYCASKL
jgi:voltage-gated potassium channel